MRSDRRQPARNQVTAKKSFLLRVDPTLWAEVERLAQADLRSANAQVEFLLRDALARRGVRPAAPGCRSRANPTARTSDGRVTRRGPGSEPRGNALGPGRRAASSVAPGCEFAGSPSVGDNLWRASFGPEGRAVPPDGAPACAGPL